MPWARESIVKLSSIGSSIRLCWTRTEYSHPWIYTCTHAQTLSPVLWWTAQSMSGRASPMNGEQYPWAKLPSPIVRIRSRQMPWSGREVHCTMIWSHRATQKLVNFYGWCTPLVESYREERDDRVCQWTYSSLDRPVRWVNQLRFQHSHCGYNPWLTWVSTLKYTTLVSLLTKSFLLANVMDLSAVLYLVKTII